MRQHDFQRRRHNAQKRRYSLQSITILYRTMIRGITFLFCKLQLSEMQNRSENLTYRRSITFPKTKLLERHFHRRKPFGIRDFFDLFLTWMSQISISRPWFEV